MSTSTRVRPPNVPHAQAPGRDAALVWCKHARMEPPSPSSTSAPADLIVDLDDAVLRSRRSVKWGAAPTDVLPAWVAEMDFALDPAVEAAVQAAVTRGEVGYGAPRDLDVAAATAGFVARRYGWVVDPAQVVITADIMAAIALALRTVCPPGAVIVPTPAYPPFLEVVTWLGRELVTVILDPDEAHARLDLDAMEHALAAGARTILLCQPHNPWGRDFSTTELVGLRDLADRYGAHVISDEVHAPLTLGVARHVPYASIDGATTHTTTIMAASKGWNVPGLKSAQVIAGTAEDCARLIAAPLVANAGGSPLGAVASIAAYGGDDQWLDALCDRIRANRDLFIETLSQAAPQARARPLEATYLQWVDARAYGFANPAQVALERGRVLVNAGTTFGPGGAGHVRVNLATSPARVVEIARRLATSWEAQPGMP